MKKIILLTLILIGSLGTTFAQRFAYVDSQYILENMPEYQEAQAELDEASKKWQQTIEAKYAEIDKLQKSYEAEKILLTKDMREKRELEITEKQKEAREYQRKKFGIKGDLFKMRQELISPLQDEIFKAIQDLAKERSYAVIFDKSANSNLLYSSPKYDKSDVILKKLGLSEKDK